MFAAIVLLRGGFWGRRCLDSLHSRSVHLCKGSAQCFSTLGGHTQHSPGSLFNSTDAGEPLPTTELGPEGVGPGNRGAQTLSRYL